MTWFRVGGAGVPASLKNGMNAVLNKKFGTSGQNYPPNGWPDDVNLLGPLPEKTVAGAIAHTDDAAATVPVKSVICSIVPKQAGTGTPSPTNVRALSGYTGLNLVRAYKNLWNGFFESGWIDNSGADNPNDDRSRSGYIQVKGGLSYYFICNLSWRIYYYDHDKTFISYIGTYTASRNITIPDNACYIRFAVIALEPTGVSLNYPNSDTESHTPSSVLSIADNWSSIGAILGGERNLSDGTMSSYGYLYDLGSNNWTADANRPGVFYSNVSASGREAASNVLGCDCFETRNITVSTSYDNYISGAPSYGGAIIFIRCTDYANMTGAEVKTALNGKYACLKSSNATSYSGLSTYDFETLYAVNNFFSDIVGGQTQVTYRQDIALALQAVSSSRGLMMASRPVTQLIGEESDPDQVNELVENDETEQEGENDAR